MTTRPMPGHLANQRDQLARRAAGQMLNLPQQAGILSGDPKFAEYIATVHQFPGDPASFIRGWCDVASRRDLATDPAAAHNFQTLRTGFDAWRGRLPPQR